MKQMIWLSEIALLVSAYLSIGVPSFSLIELRSMSLKIISEGTLDEFCKSLNLPSCCVEVKGFP